jgi:hypothetical protein
MDHRLPINMAGGIKHGHRFHNWSDYNEGAGEGLYGEREKTGQWANSREGEQVFHIFYKKFLYFFPKHGRIIRK